MEKKKLKIESLKLQSFITSANIQANGGSESQMQYGYCSIAMCNSQQTGPYTACMQSVEFCGSGGSGGSGDDTSTTDANLSPC